MSALGPPSDPFGAPEQNLENAALYDAPLTIGVALDIHKLIVIVLNDAGVDIGASGYKGFKFEIEDVSQFTTARELITKVTDRLQCSPGEVRIWAETEYHDFLHRKSRSPWSHHFPKYPLPIDFPSEARVCAFFETNAVVVERVAESDRREEEFPSSVKPTVYDLKSWLKKQQSDWKCESVEGLPKDKDFRTQLVLMETARTAFSKSSASKSENSSEQSPTAADASSAVNSSSVTGEPHSSPSGPVKTSTGPVKASTGSGPVKTVTVPAKTSTDAHDAKSHSSESTKENGVEEHVDVNGNDEAVCETSEQNAEEADDDIPDLASLEVEEDEDVPAACADSGIRAGDSAGARTHASTLFATLGYLFQDLTGVRGRPQPSIFESPSVRLQLRAYALKHGDRLDQAGFFGGFLSSEDQSGAEMESDKVSSKTETETSAASEKVSPPHQRYADRVMEESYLGGETDLWLAALSEGCLIHVFDVRKKKLKVYGEPYVERYGNPLRLGPRFVASMARWTDGNYDPICFSEIHGAIPVQREKPFHVDKTKRIFAWMARQKGHYLAPARTCAGCARREAAPGTYLRCGQCRVAYYCHAKCQRAHWRKMHRGVCRPWSALKAESRLNAEEAAFIKEQEEERKNPRNNRRPEEFRRPDMAGGGYSGIRNDRRGGGGRRRGRGRGNRGRMRGGFRSRGRGRGYRGRGRGRGGAHRGGRGRGRGGGGGGGGPAQNDDGYREHRDNPHRPNFGSNKRWKGISVGGDDDEDLTFGEWQALGLEGDMPESVADRLAALGDRAVKGELEGDSARGGRRGRDGRLRDQSREERATANAVTMDDDLEVLGSGATKFIRSRAKIESPELAELAESAAVAEPERGICEFTEEELANYKLIGDEPPKYMGDKFKRMADVMPINDEEDIGVLMTGSGFIDDDMSDDSEDLSPAEDSSDEEVESPDANAAGKTAPDDKSKKAKTNGAPDGGSENGSEGEADSDDEDPENWDAYS